jgi:hypothetical protein
MSVRGSAENYNDLMNDIRLLEKGTEVTDPDLEVQALVRKYGSKKRASEASKKLYARFKKIKEEAALKGIRRFRAAVFTVFFPYVLKKFAEEKRIKYKQASLDDMIDGIRLYSEVCKGWIVKV